MSNSTTTTNNNSKKRTVRPWKHLHQQEYDTIKLLLSTGLSTRTVAEIKGRSYNTIHNIKKSESLEDYRKTVTAQTARNYARRTAAAKAESVPAKAEQTEEVAVKGRTYFSEDSVNLERIASALERLAEAWERQPEKKSIFGK